MDYFRDLKTLIQRRLGENAPLIQVVIGPRQVGKTTAIRQAFPQGKYVTADSPVPFVANEIEGWWTDAISSPTKTLIIDEVQKIRGWAEIVKRLWDQRKGSIKLLLSGSAAVSIEKELKESLAGRYELIRADHWNYSEAKEVFGMKLNEYIEFGCYPGSITFLSDRERWASYIRDSIVEPVIGRDILQLHPIENPALLRQLFGFCISVPAQAISLNKLQGQLGDRGAIATIQNYLELLSMGFLVTGLQKYSPQPIRVRRSSPKIIVHDNALIRAFERPVGLTIEPSRFGRYLENAVAARFIESGWDTYYWSERNLEVDLVVIGPNGERLAIEVKSGEVEKKELNGLRIFCERHKGFTPCIVSQKKTEIPGFKYLPAESVLRLGFLQSNLQNFT